MRTAFAIYVMLLFYAGIWLGFCAVYRRKRKDISIRSSTIITVIRVVCTTLILIDSVLDRPGITAAVFDSFLVLLLGLTHSIMVYYHLASKPNLQDVTLQYQDMAGTIRTLSQMSGMVIGITIQAILLYSCIQERMSDVWDLKLNI